MKNGRATAAITAVLLSGLLGYGAYVIRQLSALNAAVAALNATFEERTHAIDQRLDFLQRSIEQRR
jgi:hypothetical protein